MHQNRWRLGLRPHTPLGELTALPRPRSWIQGGLTSKGRGREARAGERQGRGGEGRGVEGRGGKGG